MWKYKNSKLPLLYLVYISYTSDNEILIGHHWCRPTDRVETILSRESLLIVGQIFIDGGGWGEGALGLIHRHMKRRRRKRIKQFQTHPLSPRNDRYMCRSPPPHHHHPDRDRTMTGLWPHWQSSNTRTGTGPAEISRLPIPVVRL